MDSCYLIITVLIVVISLIIYMTGWYSKLIKWMRNLLDFLKNAIEIINLIGLLVLIGYIIILICQIVNHDPLLLISSIKEDRSQMPGKKRQISSCDNLKYDLVFFLIAL